MNTFHSPQRHTQSADSRFGGLVLVGTYDTVPQYNAVEYLRRMIIGRTNDFGHSVYRHSLASVVQIQKVAVKTAVQEHYLAWGVDVISSGVGLALCSKAEHKPTGEGRQAPGVNSTFHAMWPGRGVLLLYVK